METKKYAERTIEGYAVYFVVIYLVVLVWKLFINNAWEDRSEFFQDGSYSPTFLGMLINEIFLPYLMAKIIFIKFEKKYALIFLLCSIVYYSRAPLVLLSISLFISNKISVFTKIVLIIPIAIFSLIILYLRFNSLSELVALAPEFYGKYALVGIGRLLVTELNPDATFFNFLSIIFRPFEILFFPIDYIFNLEGYLSAARFSGYELNKFVYIELLNSNYNAFGTILFPYFLILGSELGVLVFCMWAIFYFFALTLWIRDARSTLLYMLMLGISGILFSWCGPFVWIAPFLLEKNKLTRLM